MREAIRIHLNGTREVGLAIQEPSSVAGYIENRRNGYSAKTV